MAPFKRQPSPFFNEWKLKDCRKVPSEKIPAPHQDEALARLATWHSKRSKGSKGGILVLPTGAGKTFTAVNFLCQGPLSDGYKVLWLAHTHHLLEQAFRSFDPAALGNVREPRSKLAIRVVSGTVGHFPPRDIATTDDVLVATLQTITNAHRANLRPFRKFLESANGKLFIVFDEAHHAPAPSYRKLLQDLCVDGSPVLGLTATPTYSDEARKGWLKKLFPQGILSQARASDLMASGVLAKPRFVPAHTEIVPTFDEADYQKWLGTYGDIPDELIDQLAENRERNALIARTYSDNRTTYGKTIIFTDRWVQCEAIVEALRKQGVKAGAVYSHVDAPAGTVEARKRRTRDENNKVLDRFRRNELDVLVNIRMLTEGTDIPDAQTVFLTRQTTSQILLTQMVGRALRGPKFEGTSDAYIVSFIDDWRQAIRWAEYDPLAEGRADDSVRMSAKRPPLQLVSVDLVKKLARQMAYGGNITPGPFISLMPVGWYAVTFDANVSGTDEVESSTHLVMVFDDERKGFEKLIAHLEAKCPRGLDREDAVLEDVRELLLTMRSKFLPEAGRAESDLLFDMFQVARHIAQGHGTPVFYPFELRRDHDLDAIAADFIQRDLGPRAIQELLQAEFVSKKRFWRALFPRFEYFRHYYDGCQARLLGVSSGSEAPHPRADESPSFPEPDDEIKKQVRKRDGQRCLACGSTRMLEVDHIVPVYRGGSHDMDNLQTLCKVCNSRKATRSLRFTVQRTTASRPPDDLERFDVPPAADAGKRDHWERFSGEP